MAVELVSAPCLLVVQGRVCRKWIAHVLLVVEGGNAPWVALLVRELNLTTLAQGKSIFYPWCRLCRWSLREPQPTFSFGFEGHADWVNDLALVNDTLLSCSSDTTIKVRTLPSSFSAPHRDAVHVISWRQIPPANLLVYTFIHAALLMRQRGICGRCGCRRGARAQGSVCAPGACTRTMCKPWPPRLPRTSLHLQGFQANCLCGTLSAPPGPMCSPGSRRRASLSRSLERLWLRVAHGDL